MKDRAGGSAGSAERSLSPPLGNELSITKPKKGGPFTQRGFSVPFNKSVYMKVPEFRERPTSYFKAAEEFTTGVRKMTVVDKNESVKKILEDDDVLKSFNRS